MGQAFGPLCISTIPSTGQPLLDSAASEVDKWGEGRHGGLVVRLRRRCLVVTVRGSRPSTFDRYVRPRVHWRRWRHRFDAPPRPMSPSDGCN